MKQKLGIRYTVTNFRENPGTLCTEESVFVYLTETSVKARSHGIEYGLSWNVGEEKQSYILASRKFRGEKKINQT
jgi:hypothetical protein